MTKSKSVSGKNSANSIMDNQTIYDRNGVIIVPDHSPKGTMDGQTIFDE